MNESEYKFDFHSRLKNFRKKNGFTPNAMGEFMNVSTSSYYKIERGERRIAYEEVMALIERTNLSCSESLSLMGIPKKMNKLIIKRYIFFLFVNCFLLFASAQIYKGGNIYIGKTLGNTYTVVVLVAIDWPIVINKPYLKINWGDGSPLDSISYAGSNCTLHGASTLRYVGTHTFGPAGLFITEVIESFFVANISNIPNSSTQKLYLRCELNTNSYAQPSSSPYPLYCLTDSSCCYNPSVVDSDGDSLSFSLVIPPMITGYALPPASIDPMSGVMVFTTYVPGLTSASIKIDEWRKNLSNVYVKIGATYQELLFKMPMNVGIKELKELDKTKVFPNPASNYLSILSEQNLFEGSEIEILDMLGQKVMKINFSNTIDVSNLSKGMYYLKIQNNAEQKNFKIIKE